MQILMPWSSRKGNKRAAVASLLAWLVLLLIVAATLGVVILRSAAASGVVSGLKTPAAGAQPQSLLICAPTRNAVHQIEVTALNQATLLAEPCIRPLQTSRPQLSHPQPFRLQSLLQPSLQSSMENPT